MKKKILSLCLALTLIVAMAIPASAFNVSMARSWNGFYYSTSDTCNLRSFGCSIESDSSEYTVKTDVATYVRNSNGDNVYKRTYYTNPSTMFQYNGQSVDYEISYIYCSHVIRTTTASNQQVWAS